MQPPLPGVTAWRASRDSAPVSQSEIDRESNVSIVLGAAEIRGSRKPGKGNVAAKASLTEQLKLVYEGIWETLRKTGFSPDGCGLTARLPKDE